jgi:hypothetical protein
VDFSLYGFMLNGCAREMGLGSVHTIVSPTPASAPPNGAAINF